MEKNELGFLMLIAAAAAYGVSPKGGSDYQVDVNPQTETIETVVNQPVDSVSMRLFEREDRPDSVSYENGKVVGFFGTEAETAYYPTPRVENSYK